MPTSKPSSPGSGATAAPRVARPTSTATGMSERTRILRRSLGSWRGEAAEAGMRRSEPDERRPHARLSSAHAQRLLTTPKHLVITRRREYGPGSFKEGSRLVDATCLRRGDGEERFVLGDDTGGHRGRRDPWPDPGDDRPKTLDGSLVAPLAER